MLSTDGLTTAQVLAVEVAQAQATGYVWGRQDAGESGRDTGYSLDFGKAYGAAKLEYVTERRFMLPPIQAAFNEWRESGVITTGKHYVG